MRTFDNGTSARVRNGEAPVKPRIPERVIEERKLEVERKTFFICVRENHQGRFCRITEDVRGRRNAIIIPESGLFDFAELIQELAASAKQAEAIKE